MSLMSGGVATKDATNVPSVGTNDADKKNSTSSSCNNLSTRQNMHILIDEIETISKALILQTSNSSKPRNPNEPNVDLMELTKILVQKQTELNNFCNIAMEQKTLHEKIIKVKEQLENTETNVKRLITCLKEAEHILSSAVYQAKMKLDMIHKSKPLPSEEIIRYAHKISSDNAVCCPENWMPGNPKRPYPTDTDMRKGWLARINTTDTISIEQEETEEAPKMVARSNSQIINPVIQQDEYMSDGSSDSSSDSD